MKGCNGQPPRAAEVREGQQTCVKEEGTGERLKLNQFKFQASEEEWWGTA